MAGSPFPIASSGSAVHWSTRVEVLRARMERWGYFEESFAMVRDVKNQGTLTGRYAAIARCEARMERAAAAQPGPWVGVTGRQMPL